MNYGSVGQLISVIIAITLLICFIWGKSGLKVIALIGVLIVFGFIIGIGVRLTYLIF